MEEHDRFIIVVASGIINATSKVDVHVGKHDCFWSTLISSKDPLTLSN